nr:6626_t:CDS:2 [Entrophospora candida]
MAGYWSAIAPGLDPCSACGKALNKYSIFRYENYPLNNKGPITDDKCQVEYLFSYYVDTGNSKEMALDTTCKSTENGCATNHVTEAYTEVNNACNAQLNTYNNGNNDMAGMLAERTMFEFYVAQPMRNYYCSKSGNEYCYIKNNEPYVEANYKTAITPYNLNRFAKLFKNNECSINLHAEFKTYFSTPPTTPNLLKIFNAVDSAIKNFTPPPPTPGNDPKINPGTSPTSSTSSSSTSTQYPLPSPTSSPPPTSKGFNIISVVGAVFVIVGFVVAKVGMSKTNTNSTVNSPVNENIPADTANIPADKRNIPVDKENIPADTTNIPIDTVKIPVDTEPYVMPVKKPISQQPTKKAVTRQSPSIYDIFHTLQFFVTVALVSLIHLSDNYRNLASQLGWSFGLPNGLDIKFLSDIADEKIRSAICYIIDTTYISIISTLGTDPELTSRTGFGSYAKALSIPTYNLFFVMLITFCSAMAIAAVIASLAGLVAWLCKSLWKKWPILKTVANNIHILVLGGILRVVSIK